MAMIKKILLVVAASLVAASTSAVNAADRSPLTSPLLAQNGEKHVSAARAAAIRECSAVSRRYPQYTWGVTEITLYRVCMAQRGQAE